jgi:hypothetical protein
MKMMKAVKGWKRIDVNNREQLLHCNIAQLKGVNMINIDKQSTPWKLFIITMEHDLV